MTQGYLSMIGRKQTMCKEGDRGYQGLIDQIGEDKFQERFKYLRDTMEEFINQAGYQSSVICNDRILIHVLLDYFSDIERLKDFHGIEKVRTDKIFAYTIYWILKRKRLQFKDESIEEKDIFVNERFAVFLLINECIINCVSKKLDKEGSKKFDEYIDYVLYYFKYREYNAQVIELIIESFKMGIEFDKKKC